jgi:hypothetical protein
MLKQINDPQAYDLIAECKAQDKTIKTIAKANNTPCTKSGGRCPKLPSNAPAVNA